MNHNIVDFSMASAHKLTSPTFVGRSIEIQDIQTWLQTPHADSLVRSLSGIGGIGKTTLMTEMAKICRRSGARTIWLDGRTYARQPSDLLSGIEMILEHEYGVVRRPPMSSFDHVIASFFAHRTVVLIDNVEDIGVMEGWLLSSFIPQLPKTNHLLVLASRTGLPIKWRAHPSLYGRLKASTLDVLTYEEAKAYLRSYAIPDELAEMVAGRAAGHPLSLAIAVDAWQTQTSANPMDIVQNIANLISAEIFKEVASPELSDALHVLAIMSVARYADIAKLAASPFDPDAYRKLSGLSFINTIGQELYMHDVVGRLLRRDFYDRDPIAFRAYCQRILNYFVEAFQTGDEQLRRRIPSQFLRVYLELMPIRHEYADFPEAPTSGLSGPFHPDDLPYLHHMLDGAMAQATWQCELIVPGTHHALLDEIARDYPESIRIVRSESGQPLTMGVAIRLYKRTIPLLETYAPGYIHDVFTDEMDVLEKISEEESDSLCILMSAVDMEHPVHRPEKLGVLSFLDWYELISAGTRSIVAAADTVFIQLLLQFGYRDVGKITHAETGDTLTVLECDFRNEMFESWAKAMLNQSTHTEPKMLDDGDRERISKSAAIPYSEIKDILKYLNRPLNLEHTPLAQKLGMTGGQLQQIIYRLLTCEPPVLPMTVEDQSILLKSFSERHAGKQVLADAYNISRTTLYRHTRNAIENLAQALLTSSGNVST